MGLEGEDNDVPINDDDEGDADNLAENEPTKDDEFENLFISTPAAAAIAPDELTEEQMERIRQNREKAEKIRREKLSQKSREESTQFNNQPINLDEEMDEDEWLSENRPAPLTPVIQPPQTVELTEEQMERINQNRQKALKLRQERMKREMEMSESQSGQLKTSSDSQNDLSLSQTVSNNVNSSEMSPNTNEENDPAPDEEDKEEADVDDILLKIQTYNEKESVIETENTTS